MGMYGLKQAGILANKLLTKCLSLHGYYQSILTPGLWCNRWRNIMFCLVVDDFGIQYVKQQDADHLISSVKAHYQVKIDWTGALFCGITLDWNYSMCTVHLSMPGYLGKALHKFQHIVTKYHQDLPHPHIPIKYEAGLQLVHTDKSPPLTLDKWK